MKKWYSFPFIAIVALLTGCNNNSDGKTAADSVTMQKTQENTKITDPGSAGTGDTASYERMSQKTTDTIQHP